MLREYLLGFDARLEPGHCSRDWTSAQRAMFLLRTDVPVPLAVDDQVWPSVFSEAGPSSSELDEQALESLIAERAISNAGLWNDLATLKEHLQRRVGKAPTPHWVIAVTCFCDSTLDEIVGFRLDTELPQPPKVAPDWRLLGYDVADGGPISGLSNCSYSAAEARTLSTEWSRDLNEFHLFKDRERASEFASLTNIRMPDHRPFFVYGLWLIPS